MTSPCQCQPHAAARTRARPHNATGGIVVVVVDGDNGGSGGVVRVDRYIDVRAETSIFFIGCVRAAQSIIKALQNNNTKTFGIIHNTTRLPSTHTHTLAVIALPNFLTSPLCDLPSSPRRSQIAKSTAKEYEAQTNTHTCGRIEIQKVAGEDNKTWRKTLEANPEEPPGTRTKTRGPI